MAVKYIDVKTRSDLFVPAIRSFGDIAIIGKGGIGTSSSDPKEFTDPLKAAEAYPPGATKLTAGAATGATTVSVGASVRPGTTVEIDGDKSEVRTVKSVTGQTSPYTLTLDSALAKDHAADAAVKQLGSTDLAAAVAVAFGQSPPPTKIWGVQVAADSPQWDTALNQVAALDVQIVVLANTPLNDANEPAIQKLANHVVATSNTGGDGKERIGVAMLDHTLSATDASAFNRNQIRSERMFLVASKTSGDDVAAAAAGVIAGHEPQESMLLKPIRIGMTGTFTDQDITAFDSKSINWITSPTLIPDHSLFIGEGYTANPSGNKKYIDVVRTLDDVNFRIKAALIQAIGDLRISRSGMRSIVTLVQSVLSPLVAQEVIEDYSVHIPLLVLLDRDQATLSGDEVQQIADRRRSRLVDMTVSVVYAGAIHRLNIELVFK
jgi:hypothetical protein